jgi:hypothetical protein
MKSKTNAECCKLFTKGQHPQYFLAEPIAPFVNLKFYHSANNWAKYADGYFNPTIDDKEDHILLPLSICTSNALGHGRWGWQKITGVHPKFSK